MAKRPSARSAGSTTKARVGAAAVVLVAIAGLTWYMLGRTKSVSGSTLEQWVVDQKFEPMRPIRSSYTPGTLVLLSAGDRDRIAMAAQDFIEPGQPGAISARVPDTTLSVEYVLGSSLSIGSAVPQEGSSSAPANGEGSGKVGATLRASLKLSQVETLTLPLNRVRDLVQKNKRVQEALQRSPDNLFIVLESLTVKNLEFTFADQALVGAKASFPDELKALFAADLRFGADGRVFSDSPMVIGATLGKLSVVSSALGAGERQVEVKPMAPTEIAKFRQAVAVKSASLYSGFDVFGMSVGFGNYSNRSQRAGGELPDAVTTAEGMADALRRLVPVTEANRIRTFSSEELGRGMFDSTRRTSRRALLAAVDDFVADIKQRSDPNHETLAVFYFFGHGLADGISKSVFLVPEAFVDDESKPVTDVAQSLVSVEEITKKLETATDHIVVLVDACRSHKDEAKTLIDAWRLGLKQGSDVEGIIGALQFASGVYGPHAVIFASADGVAAPTVAVPEKGFASGTGPLYLAVVGTLDGVSRTGGTVDLPGFIQAISRPQRFGSNGSVRGFTYMREDFVKEFGPVILFGSEPTGVARRRQPFRAPGYGLTSRLGSRLDSRPQAQSGVTVEIIAEIDQEQIQETAANADGSEIWILDEGNRVFSVSRGSLTRINPDIPFTSVAWDRQMGLVGAEWDEAKLYRYDGSRWLPIREETRPLFLVSSGRDEVVALSQQGPSKFG